MRHQWIKIYEMIDVMPLEEKKHLLNYLNYSVREIESKASSLTYLEKQWIEIKRCMKSLDFEPNIDDQISIEEKIRSICMDLIKCGKIEESSWEIRRAILQDIISDNYFDEYGAAAPMKELFSALCISKQERIKCADMCFSCGSNCMKKDGAALYLENGMLEKYYDYIEKNLSQDGTLYLELIDYYKNRDYGKALETAQLAMKKCKYNLTQIFIFLLQDAVNKRDDAKYLKLMRSAKQRKTINYPEVLKAMGQLRNRETGLK